jgi:hypothetical protein
MLNRLRIAHLPSLCSGMALALLAACGTDPATRERPSDEDTSADTGLGDTTVDPDGSGDTTADTTVDPDGSGDTTADTTVDPDGSGDTTADTTVDPDGSGDTTPESFCGDGIVDEGEACDDGEANSATEPDACRPDCSAPRCGDAVRDSGEACDDGGEAPLDGCAADCTIEVIGDRLCAPCVADADCGPAGYACVAGTEPYCALDCSSDGACPVGYGCRSTIPVSGGTARLCLPDGGSCAGCTDADGDGFGPELRCAGIDCDDADAQVFEGAPERCDLADNDCNGAIDEGCACRSGEVLPCGTDTGACVAGTQVCVEGVWSGCSGATGAVEETCDAIDNDCDGAIDDSALGAQRWYPDGDGDGVGRGTTFELSCGPTGRFTAATTGDCNDADANVAPGRPELCDRVDNDCNATTADGLAEPGFGAACDGADGDLCVEGVTACTDGALVCNEPAGDNAEVCDGIDNDCDGAVDEVAPATPIWFVDTDGDGFGRTGSTLQACTAPPGYVATGGDCQDAEPGVYPGAVEACEDGIDNNCDGDRDCADATCADLALCDLVEFCDNGIDDNSDGAVDCADATCLTAPVCTVGACLSGELGSVLGSAVATGNLSGQGNDGNASCGGNASDDMDFYWTAPTSGTFQFGLSDTDYDWVLSLRPPTCSATDFVCGTAPPVGGSSPALSLSMTAGQAILIRVDGLAGAMGNFALDISYAEVGSCDDAIDNDVDGLVDCFDPDCAPDDACSSLFCPSADLGRELGTPVQTGSTVGGTDRSTGRCGGAGSEVVYTWTAPAAGFYRFDTRGSTFDTVLYVRRGTCPGRVAELGCDDDIGGPSTSPNSLRSEVFAQLTAGELVSIYVDTYSATGGTFSLNIARSEHGGCGNGADDDGDGSIDCADTDCNGELSASVCREVCNDGIDNNDNGIFDCFETSCSLDRWCDEVCDDGIDNDGDLAADCADPECDVATNCVEICNDVVDNNGDGLADCADPGCVGSPSCLEQCTGRRDEDLDGLVDCADPDCSSNAACPENCTNGVDDDANGAIDCLDTECSLLAACCPADAFENNDLASAAVAESVWAPLTGSTLTVLTGDDDYFALTTCVGAVVSARLDFANARGNIDLDLRTASGTVAAQSRGFRDFETITYTAPRAETMYLRVFVSASTTACNSYVYSFSVDRSGCAP